MKGWVDLVGWPVADGLPTLVVTHQLQVERRTGKVRLSETDVLPLCHAATVWVSNRRRVCVPECACKFHGRNLSSAFCVITHTGSRTISIDHVTFPPTKGQVITLPVQGNFTRDARSHTSRSSDDVVRRVTSRRWRHAGVWRHCAIKNAARQQSFICRSMVCQWWAAEIFLLNYN